MPSVFRATTEADLDGIERIFRLAFHPPDDAQILDRAILRWKYHEPRPDWPGSRSYCIEKDGTIVAHAAVWPYELLTGGGSVRGAHLIDWAADTSAPGSGVSIVKKLLADVGVMCSFGGTAATRAILPKIGFKPANEIRTYARPLRPLAQLLTHQYRNWKLPIRYARNAWWRLLPALSAPAGWSAEAMTTSSGDVPMPREAADRIPCGRTPEFFAYLAKCPDVTFRWYAVRQHGKPRGYFGLATIHRQARVVDLWIENASPADYRAAHVLAARCALAAGDAAEITATSCVDQCSAGLEAAGYHLVDRVPVVISGASTPAIAGRPLDFHMVDCDFAFLTEGRVNYTT